MSKSTANSHRDKPEKPDPAFPLFAHAAGYWAKKIAGKTQYFGKWEDPDGALLAYRRFMDGKPKKDPATETTQTPAKTFAPVKPYPDFPLFAHATRRWAKKIRGHLVYFGPWEDPDGALERYLADKDDLHAGRAPRPLDGELTLRELVNRFLAEKRLLVDSEEIMARTWADYYTAYGNLLKAMGRDRLVTDLRPEDFTAYRARLAKRLGPTSIGNQIQRVSSLFKYAYDAELIDRPVRFGPGFKRPSKKTRRKHRAKKGLRMFEASELRSILEAVGQPLHAMILLGINCGFGNADVGTVPISALDLAGGWVNYPRPKTGVDRRCKLWPETIAALNAWLPTRPMAKEHAHASYVFVTRFGGPFHQVLNEARLSDKNINPSVDNPISKEMAKVLHKLRLHRPGLGFYALRHTFETIAGESRDQVAVDHVMGHARDDMASLYRERIGDDRLQAVAEHVRRWLFHGMAGDASIDNATCDGAKPAER